MTRREVCEEHGKGNAGEMGDNSKRRKSWGEAADLTQACLALCWGAWRASVVSDHSLRRRKKGDIHGGRGQGSAPRKKKNVPCGALTSSGESRPPFKGEIPNESSREKSWNSSKQLLTAMSFRQKVFTKRTIEEGTT